MCRNKIEVIKDEGSQEVDQEVSLHDSIGWITAKEKREFHTESGDKEDDPHHILSHFQDHLPMIDIEDDNPTVEAKEKLVKANPLVQSHNVVDVITHLNVETISLEQLEEIRVEETKTIERDSKVEAEVQDHIKTVKGFLIWTRVTRLYRLRKWHNND